jgi:hypothetical protein
MASESREKHGPQCAPAENGADHPARAAGAAADFPKPGRAGKYRPLKASGAPPLPLFAWASSGEEAESAPDPGEWQEGDELVALGAENDLIDDEELRDMLEQLNDTLESANTVLAGNHALAESMAVDGAATPQTPEKGKFWRGLASPAMAAALGVMLGIAALVLLWPLWTSQDLRIGKPAKDTARIAETVAVRSLPMPRQESFSAQAFAPLHPVTGPAPADLPIADTPAQMTPPEVQKDERDEKAGGPEQEPSRTALVTTAIPAVAPPQPLGGEAEASLTARGNKLLEAGDIVSARLVFGYGARRGSADAMFSIARTFDPDYLSQRQVHGLKGDPAMARHWYEKAAEAGHALAAQRLQALPGNTMR